MTHLNTGALVLVALVKAVILGVTPELPGDAGAVSTLELDLTLALVHVWGTFLEPDVV